MHGHSGQPGRLDLAQLPLAAMLMPHGHSRRGMVRVDAVGDQQVGWDRVVGLGLVRHRLDPVAILGNRLAELRPQFARLGPRSAEALEQLLPKSGRWVSAPRRAPIGAMLPRRSQWRPRRLIAPRTCVAGCFFRPTEIAGSWVRSLRARPRLAAPAPLAARAFSPSRSEIVRASIVTA